MTKITPRGRIEYSGRAFHQDAMAAMKGDIVRGLIELITNSDDAYAAMENGSKQRKIIIEVEHRRTQPWEVIVRDRAIGMNADTMIERITKLGGRTSGFEEGQDRRGNLGRGAKDLAAFGDISFVSIHDGMYGKLLLQSNGEWEMQEDRKATSKDRKDLGIPKGNGTVVTVYARENIVCRNHETLKRNLSTHFQLRDILSDQQRRVELIKLNDGTRSLLTFVEQEHETLFDGEIEIDDFPEAKSRLVIHRLKKRFDDSPQDTGRPTGILVKGKRAIYDNTLFKFEHDVHAGWFCGELRVPYIDQLAREYDDHLEEGEPEDPKNPMPIINRHRDGLNRDHPFVKVLYEAAEKPLGDLVAQEIEKAAEVTAQLDDRTRSDLEKLAKEVSKLVNEELREIDAELLEFDFEGEVPLLSIVPEIAFAYIGENKTLSIAARNDNISVGDEVQVDIDPEGVVELLTPIVELKIHSRREDILVGQIKLRPTLEGEAVLITATLDEKGADAIVEVKPPREEVEVEVEPPDTFIFERPSYRVGWHRGKDLQLIAPAEVVAQYGAEVLVKTSHPGIVLRTQTAELKYDDAVDYFRCSIRVEARVLDATSLITAELGDLIASTQVKVTRKEQGETFRIDLIPEKMGMWRATMETEKDESDRSTRVIKVYGRHPAIVRYLGEDFGNVNDPICRAILAEIVADVAARHVVEHLYMIRRTAEEFDAVRIYREHYKRMLRFLPRFQRLLIGDISKAGFIPELSEVVQLEPGT